MNVSLRQKITPSALNNDKGKKYVRYHEGAEMYGMCLKTFQRLAKDAGACSKYRNVVLVNVQAVNEFLETCRVD